MFNIVKLSFLGAALIVSGAIHAETPQAASPATAAAAQQQPKAAQVPLHQQAQALQQKLGAIQQSALTANPKLAEEQQALQDMVMDAMKAEGANPEKDTSRLKELQQQASQPGVTQDQRMEMAQEFQTIRQRLQTVQQKVLQDEKVQKAQQEFRDKLLVAMNKQDSNTEEMVKQLEGIVQQLQVQQMIQQQMQQQQAQANQAPPGPVGKGPVEK